MSTLAADVAAASHRFQMEYGHDATADNLIHFLRMEAEAEERLELAKLRERMEKQREEKMRLEREQAMYARVKFTPGGRLYNYEVADCAVGDWIVVPPNSMRNAPSILEVIELGRGTGTASAVRPTRSRPRSPRGSTTAAQAAVSSLRPVVPRMSTSGEEIHHHVRERVPLPADVMEPRAVLGQRRYHAGRA